MSLGAVWHFFFSLLIRDMKPVFLLFLVS